VGRYVHFHFGFEDQGSIGILDENPHGDFGPILGSILTNPIIRKPSLKKANTSLSHWLYVRALKHEE